jgi:hypothetical protein
MTVRATNGQALGDLMAAWHEAEAGKAPGYLGSRLLADRDDPGRFLIVVDFSSFAEAELNNDRAESRVGKLRRDTEGRLRAAVGDGRLDAQVSAEGRLIIPELAGGTVPDDATTAAGGEGR